MRQTIIETINHTGFVDAIDPGSYPWPSATTTLYKGDGFTSCPYGFAISGAVTLTRVDSEGIAGTYQFTIDGQDVTGTLNSTVCWSSADVRGPCVQ